MHAALRTLLALALMIAGGAAYAAESKPYARDFLASDAVRLAETLRKETAASAALIKGKSPEQLRKEAAAIAENPGASSLEVAEMAGIKDKGQASKLFARLATLRVIENTAESRGTRQG